MLDPRAVRAGVLDQLDTSVLLTLPAYLATASGGSAPSAASAASPGPPGTGRRDVPAHQRATWYFAAALGVKRLEVPDADARQDASAGTQIGLLTSSGSIHWFRAAAAGTGRLAISLPRPLRSVAVVAQSGGHASRLGPASVADTHGQVFVEPTAQLQDALLPPRWGYAGRDGSFSVFVDRFARGPLRLQALPGRSASGASVRAGCGAGRQPGRGGRLLPARRPGRPVGGGHGRAGPPTWHPRRGARSRRWPCAGTAWSRPLTCRPGGAS